MGVIKAKFLVKPCLKITQNFLGDGGGGGAKQKPSVGGSMDIFWNCTLDHCGLWFKFHFWDTNFTELAIF